MGISKIIRVYILALLGFILSPICHAQTGLDTLYKIQDGYKAFTELYAYNADSAYVLCTARDYNAPDSLKKHHILVLHLNLKDGSIKQLGKIQKAYHSIYYYALRGFADSNHFIFWHQDSVNSKTYIAYKHGSWDSIAIAPLGIPLADYRTCMGQKIENGYLFTGTTGFYTTSPTFIAFFDNQFQLKRYYTYPFKSWLKSVTQISPNRFLLSGGYTPADAETAFQLYNLCIDSMGKIIWQKFHSGYQNNDNNLYVNKDVYYKNRLYQYGMVQNGWNLLAAMNIVDTSGNIINEGRYPSLGLSNSFEKIIEHRGSLYALGIVDSIFPNDSISDLCVTLSKINPENGDIRWTQRYRHWSRWNGMYNLYAINNQLYMLGMAINPNRLAEMDSIKQVQPDAWLLKVDTNGCVVPGCNPDSNYTATHFLLGNDELVSVFPNPSAEQFSLHFHPSFPRGACEVQLYDASGKLLLKQSFNTTPLKATFYNQTGYSGMAYLRIKTPQGNFYRKILLQ